MIGAALRSLWALPVPGGAFVAASENIGPATLWYPLGAAGRLPVVLYLPGRGGARTDNASLAAELTSHGFVVAALAPDLHGPDRRSPGAGGARAGATGGSEDRLDAWVRAVRNVLDELARLDHGGTGSRFADRLETARVGIVGLSFGGAAAAAAALSDSRLVAVVNVAGVLLGAAARQGVPCAYLKLSGDRPDDDPHPRRGPRVTVRGAAADSFADAILHTRLRRLRGVDPLVAQHILAECCLSFFSHALLGQGPTLPERPLPRVARVEHAPRSFGGS